MNVTGKSTLVQLMFFVVGQKAINWVDADPNLIAIWRH